MWVRIGDKYINLDNVMYTSEINSSLVTLCFINGERMDVRGSNETNKIYETMEYIRWKPKGGYEK